LSSLKPTSAPGFTEEQLAALTDAQKAALKAEFKAKLTPDQKDALG
jgi:hypothetical protein